MNDNARSQPGRVPPPLMVESPHSVTWDDEADVIVVGFGGAGAVAALEARACGADVLILDRFGGGGATAYSGGVLYAGGTRQQAASGIEDTRDDMFRYLMAEGSAVDADTMRRFCDESVANLEWLEGHGLQYGGNAYLNKTAFPPDGYWIFYSGNENVPAYAEQAKPAPRGHRLVTPGFGGHLYFAKLRESVLDKGARVLPHAPVQRLITDANGAVIGVEANVIPENLWRQHQTLYAVASPWRPFNGERSERAIAKCRALEASVHSPRRIRARAGVILATGGFIYNLDMLRRYHPVLAHSYKSLLRIGSMGDDGSGIELGQSVGGGTALMEHMYLGRPLAPPEAFVYGLIVNAEARRFVNEDAYQSVFGQRLAEQPGNARAWLILDHEHFWLGVKQSVFAGKGRFMQWGAPALMNICLGGTKRAASVRVLARRCGLDPEVLESTIEGFNARARGGQSDVFGKGQDKMKALAQGPFYAVNVSMDNRFGISFASTLGGLRVNEATGEVQTSDGESIEGLYAAGRCALGVNALSHASGMSIADTVFAGRRAGQHAAGKIHRSPIAQDGASATPRRSAQHG
jgi:3-oxo-5alpha-steroid 4-dehydrogenase